MKAPQQCHFYSMYPETENDQLIITLSSRLSRAFYFMETTLINQSMDSTKASLLKLFMLFYAKNIHSFILTSHLFNFSCKNSKVMRKQFFNRIWKVIFEHISVNSIYTWKLDNLVYICL